MPERMRDVGNKNLCVKKETAVFEFYNTKDWDAVSNVCHHMKVIVPKCRLPTTACCWHRPRDVPGHRTAAMVQ